MISGKSMPVCTPTEVLFGENKQVKYGETVCDLVFEKYRFGEFEIMLALFCQKIQMLFCERIVSE